MPYLKHRQPVVGDTYGSLTVIAVGPVINRSCGRLFLCQCACGTVRYFRRGNLMTGNTLSCGCSKAIHPNRLRHGHSPRTQQSPEYSTWQQLKRRCLNPRSKSWPAYGGRGIRVHPLWQASFEAFLRDVGLRPTPEHSIERIDNNGDYVPGNVKWATRLEQMNNTRRNHFETFNGERLTIAQWARRFGLRYAAVRNRLYKGWTIGDIVATLPHFAPPV